MNWAWGIDLPPTKKLILMSLADNADDLLQCFPSTNYIAIRCCVSKRTVSRTLKYLQEQNLINIKLQYRRNGSNCSNLYTLNLTIKEGDKFTPPFKSSQRSSDRKSASPKKNRLDCRPPMTSMSLMGGIDAPPLTTNQAQKEPLERTTTAFEWPKQLGEDERRSIMRRAGDTGTVVVQMLIDELAGQIKNVKSPVGYFNTLLLRYQSGDFIPAKSISTQASRHSRKKNQLALEASVKLADEHLAQCLKAMENKNHEK